VDCTMIDRELVAFHFGELGGAPRAAVEEHLPGCARCLRAYLDLKRAIEGAGEGAGESEAERPSDLARARLRSAIAREVGRRRWWWVAGGAVAAAGALVAVLIRHPQLPPVEPRPAPASMVDTAAPAASSLNVW
jgi:anti-sigma factor RsiW